MGLFNRRRGREKHGLGHVDLEALLGPEIGHIMGVGYCRNTITARDVIVASLQDRLLIVTEGFEDHPVTIRFGDLVGLFVSEQPTYQFGFEAGLEAPLPEELYVSSIGRMALQGEGREPPTDRIFVLLQWPPGVKPDRETLRVLSRIGNLMYQHVEYVGHPAIARMRAAVVPAV